MDHYTPSDASRSRGTTSTRSTSPISFAVRPPTSNDLVNLVPPSRPKRTRRPATAPSESERLPFSGSLGQEKWANNPTSRSTTRPATADSPSWSGSAFEPAVSISIPALRPTTPASSSASSKFGDMARSLKKKASASFLSGTSSSSSSFSSAGGRPPKSPVKDKALPPVPAITVVRNPLSDAHAAARTREPPPFTKVSRKEVKYDNRKCLGAATPVTISLSPTQEVRVVGGSGGSPTRKAFALSGLSLERTVTAPDYGGMPPSLDEEQVTRDMQNVLSRLRKL